MSRTKQMPAVEATIFSKIMDWLWLGVVGVLTVIFRKLFMLESGAAAHDTEIALLRQQQKRSDQLRVEADRRRDDQRSEIIDMINEHHRDITKQLQHLSDKIDAH